MIELISQSPEYGGRLSIRQMCKALSVSRASFYRERFAPQLVDKDMELRDEIQRIALDMPFYGYRRITEELHRRNWSVNHKRILRLMRQDNLLCLRKKMFVATTDSEHPWRIYPNLARDLVVDGVNQLWVSDITYIRLMREFIYLAVILDVCSRRCIGWSLGRRLNAELALSALRIALGSRVVVPGLVHHSDRGVQYASKDYTDLLKDNGIAISMSRRGNPYDNAYAESFMKTLKYEEVYLSEYETIADARSSIEHFIEEVYNSKRLHSSLGYVPPVEYEQQLELKLQAITP